MLKNLILKEHFLNPKNMGEISNPDYSSIVKSETCNDIVKLMILIDTNGIIKEIKAQVYGCGYSIAGASLFTENINGLKIDKAGESTIDIIQKAIDGIPERHVSCVKLAQKAFENIYKKYLRDK